MKKAPLCPMLDVAVSGVTEQNMLNCRLNKAS